MSLSRPRAVLTVGGRQLKSAEAALARLQVSLGLGAHDAAALTVWPSSKLASTSSGDTLAIALGEDGSETDVWSGEVTEVSAGGDAILIDGLAATVALSRTRMSQTYLDQSVADIVRDLASSVTVDEVQGDTQLKAYAVDDRRPVWNHLLDLAALVGADVECSASGGLRFVPVKTGSADVTLHYKTDLLAWSAGGAPQPKVAKPAPYGSASSAGADKWHWILRSPTGSGSGDGPTLVIPAFHTSDAADSLAQALSDRATRAKLQGRLRIVGNATVRPGDLVDISGLPAGDPATLRVRAVEHLLDGRDGFITTLTVEGAGG
jgi:hypothetical protein